MPSFLSWVACYHLVCYLVFRIFSLGFNFLSNAESVTKRLLSCLQNLVFVVFSSFLFVFEGLCLHPTLLFHHLVWFPVLLLCTFNCSQKTLLYVYYTYILHINSLCMGFFLKLISSWTGPCEVLVVTMTFVETIGLLYPWLPLRNL